MTKTIRAGRLSSRCRAVSDTHAVYIVNDLQSRRYTKTIAWYGAQHAMHENIPTASEMCKRAIKWDSLAWFVCIGCKITKWVFFFFCNTNDYWYSHACHYHITLHVRRRSRVEGGVTTVQTTAILNKFRAIFFTCDDKTAWKNQKLYIGITSSRV